LLAWFTLDLTGFSFGDLILVISAFSDEPVDAAFWLLYAACVSAFVFKERVGRWLLPTFAAIWGFIQFGMYLQASPEHIASYNAFFAHEGTAYLVTPSDTVLIKDAYHMVLDLLIAVTFVLSLVYLVQSLRQKASSPEGD
jgi:hypothetical protein